MVTDTIKCKLILPWDKASAIKSLATLTIRSSSALLMTGELMGLLISIIDTVQWARFHTRTLQHFLGPYQTQIIRKAERNVQLPLKVKESLVWKMTLDHRCQPLGLGSDLQRIDDRGNLVTYGKETSHQHIGAKSGVPGLDPFFRPAERRPRPSTDRQYTGQSLYSQPGWFKIVQITQGSHQSCSVGGSLHSISTGHIRGLSDSPADWLSRQCIQEGEWSLSKDLFHLIMVHFGIPVVDLFASHSNNQVERFYSRYFHPRVEKMDDLTASWPQGLLYAFPPIPLLPRLLHRIKVLKAQVLVVAPFWPRRPWFSVLQNMSIATSLTLLVSKEMLTQGPLLHPCPAWYCLTLWRLSGAACDA